MIPLQTQELFEVLIGRSSIKDESEKETSPFVVVYFTARWCGACKNLDIPLILKSNPSVTFYRCDIDENDYTAGFCGITKIPTFLFINTKKITDKITSSDTSVVLTWLRKNISS